MKTRTILLLVIIISMMVLMVINAQSQVLYSSWASAQVRHSVETEKPVVKYDTIPVHDRILGAQYEVINIFLYKEFELRVIHDADIRVIVDAGSTRVMLKPDDEYAILEKLISLIR